MALAFRLDADAFGIISAVLVLATVPMAISRAVAGDAVMIVSGDERRPPHLHHLLLILIGFFAPLILAGAIAAYYFQQPLIPIVATIGLVGALQDALRYRAFSLARPLVAAVADLAWLLTFVSTAAVLLAVHQGPTAIILAWGATGLLVSLGMLFKLGVASTGEWSMLARRIRLLRVARGLLVDALMGRGVAELMILVSVGTGAAALAGHLRLAQIFAGPINTLLSASRLHAIRAFGDSAGGLCAAREVTRRFTVVSAKVVLLLASVAAAACITTLMKADYDRITAFTFVLACFLVATLFDILISARSLRSRLLDEVEHLVTARIAYSGILAIGFGAAVFLRGDSIAALSLPACSMIGYLVWVRQEGRHVRSRP